MSIYQIILATIATWLLCRTIIRFSKEKRLRFFFNLVVYTGILVLSISPNVAHIVSKKMGLGENLNTLIFTGFIVLFAILMKIIQTTEQLKREITTLVQKNAVEKFNLPKNN